MNRISKTYTILRNNGYLDNIAYIDYVSTGRISDIWNLHPGQVKDAYMAAIKRHPLGTFFVAGQFVRRLEYLYKHMKRKKRRHIR